MARLRHRRRQGAFSLRAGRVRANCITEAAIDAMTPAAIEVLRTDTLYVSTGGGSLRRRMKPSAIGQARQRLACGSNRQQSAG